MDLLLIPECILVYSDLCIRAHVFRLISSMPAVDLKQLALEDLRSSPNQHRTTIQRSFRILKFFPTNHSGLTI